MAILKINVEPREETGSRASNRMRKDGLIPAVLYSKGNPTVSLKLDGHKWARSLTDQLNLVELAFPDGKAEFAAPREIQKDPLSQDIIHVDFQGVKMDVAAEFNVAVEFIGIPLGVTEGGVRTISAEYISVECLPTLVPDSISVNIEHLEIGHNVSAGDLELPEDITLLSDPSMVLLSVTAIRVVEEDEPEEAVEGEEGEEAEGDDEKKEDKPEASDSKGS